jgi:hypothetical protein
MRWHAAALIKQGAMTQLVDALHTLGLQGEIALDGRWVMVQGERCAVYVTEIAWGGGCYTWCDDPRARTVEFYRDPLDAIQAGLRRAAMPNT